VHTHPPHWPPHGRIVILAEYELVDGQVPGTKVLGELITLSFRSVLKDEVDLFAAVHATSLRCPHDS
jgi:hypothetical protein